MGPTARASRNLAAAALKPMDQSCDGNHVIGVHRDVQNLRTHSDPQGGPVYGGTVDPVEGENSASPGPRLTTDRNQTSVAQLQAIGPHEDP